MEQEKLDNPVSPLHDADNDTIMIEAVKNVESPENTPISSSITPHTLPSIKTGHATKSPIDNSHLQTTSNVHPPTSMSYNVNMELTDEMIFKTVSNRLNYIQEATDSTRISPLTNTSPQQNQQPNQTIQPSYTTSQQIHPQPSGIDVSGIHQKYSTTDKPNIQSHANGNATQNIPSPVASLESIRNTKLRKLTKKQLWSPFNVDHLPKGEECSIIESNFGRKVKFEHSMDHSLSLMSSGNIQDSALMFSSSLKQATESIMQPTGSSTRAKLSYFADQAKRHSNLGHKHLETLANLLMQVIHDEMDKVAQLSRLIDDISTDVLFYGAANKQPSVDIQDNDTNSQYGRKRKGSNSLKSQKKPEIGDHALEPGDILAFILDKLMFDVLKREEMIEGLRTLRKSIVQLIQLNATMFRTLKKFRSKRHHHMATEERIAE